MVREGLSEGRPCEFPREGRADRGDSECKGPEAGVSRCVRRGQRGQNREQETGAGEVTGVGSHRALEAVIMTSGFTPT